MRALPLAVLAFATLLPTLGAQEAFHDKDFGFTMDLPPGLRALSAEERAAALGLTPDEAGNPARVAGSDEILSHYYMWVDGTTPYNRQIGIILRDGQPPFSRPDEMFEATARSGLALRQDDCGPMPPPVDGLRVVGTFQRAQDKVSVRKVILYLPDFAGKHYATVNIQAFDADWPIVKPEVDAALQSVRMRRTPVSSAAAARPSHERLAPVGGDSADPGQWGSLTVAGTLALALAMLAHLFLGGRPPR